MSDLPATTSRYPADIYPSVDDQALMAKVYRSYMVGMDLEEACALHGVEYRTVLVWAKNAKWVDERAELEQQATKESNRKLALQRADSVNALVADSIKTAKKITAEVNRTLASDEKLTPNSLKLLAEATKAAQQLGLQAAGIGDDGSTDEARKEGAKDGKRPLVMVFQGGGLPEVRKSVALDAEVVQ